MTRLNLILFCALMLSSLGLVNAQHKARKLYIELEQLNKTSALYDQEYGQLQLEQSTWAMHSRIELIAAQALEMQVPDAARIQVVSPGGQATPAIGTNVSPAGAVLNPLREAAKTSPANKLPASPIDKSAPKAVKANAGVQL